MGWLAVILFAVVRAPTPASSDPSRPRREHRSRTSRFPTNGGSSSRSSSRPTARKAGSRRSKSSSSFLSASHSASSLRWCSAFPLTKRCTTTAPSGSSPYVAGGFIAYYINRQNVFGSVILGLGNSIQAFLGITYIIQMLGNPPYHLLSAIVCFASILIMTFQIQKDNGNRVISILVPVVVAAAPSCSYG